MLTEAIIQTLIPTSLKIDGVSQDEILILESISGLSDVKVNLFTGEFAREGGYYQGRRAEPRNPVFNFRLQPNYNLGIMANDIREMIFRMFMEPFPGSDAVKILLKDDKLPDRYVLAYTESIKAEMFTKEMTAQCSLMTVDAYLRSDEETSGENALGWFSLPVPYLGSADTGLRMTVRVERFTPTIYIANGDDFFVLEGSFNRGDIIEISTIQGERAILLNGEDNMALLTPASRWLTLNENSNTIKVFGNEVGDGKALLIAYSYRAAWWGI